MNDSQKPGWVSAHGSNTVTTTAATRRTSAHGQRRPAACSSVTVASIQIVRCDGTPQPAKNAYAVAAARPPAAPRLGAGQPQHRPRAAPPRRADREAGEPREHGDVQAADRHQVGDAGVAEQVPVVALDRALVADRERREHAGDAPIGDVRVDRVAHALAQPLDRVAGAGVEQRRRRLAHVAGGANALLEQRELVVEAVRVQVAVRPAQAHREAPALAGAQRRARLDERGVLVKARVPAEREQRRNAGRRAAFVDREAEAQPARALLRQAGDDAGDDDVVPFELGRQRIGKPHATRASPTPRSRGRARRRRRRAQIRAARARALRMRASRMRSRRARARPRGRRERRRRAATARVAAAAARRRRATPAAAPPAVRRCRVLPSRECRI